MKSFFRIKILLILLFLGSLYILFVYSNSINKNIKSVPIGYELLGYHICPDTLEVSNKIVYANWINEKYIVDDLGYYWIINNCNKFLEPTTPILSNLGIALKDFGSSSLDEINTGVFKFDLTKNDKKPISPFGEVDNYDLNTKLAFDLLDPDTDVLAALDGEVINIINYLNELNSQIVISNDNNYRVQYLNVRNILVSQGDKVKSGQVIGKVGLNEDGNSSSFKIWIYKQYPLNNSTLHYCPLQLLPSETRTEYVTSIEYLMKAWEDYSNDSTVYDEADNYISGCLDKTYLSKPMPGPIAL